MSKIIRVQDGDYKVVTGVGGTITLDTGTNTPFEPDGWQGGVVVTGDLLVLGNTTTVESEELYVKDNIIHINNGETGAGVSTLGSTAGIQIDRGSLPSTFILWDENVQTAAFDIGTFVFVDETYNPLIPSTLSSALKPIATNGINTGGDDLYLIAGGGNGVVTVSGTADYEQRVLDYNKLNVALSIVNTQRSGGVATITIDGNLGDYGIVTGNYVDIICNADNSFSVEFTAITVINSTTFTYPNPGVNAPSVSYLPGLAGNVIPDVIYNSDTIPNMKAVADYAKSAIATYTVDINSIGQADTRVVATDLSVTGTASKIVFNVDSDEKAVINNFGSHFGNLRINNSSITNYKLLGENNVVELNSFLSLQNQAADPTSVPLGYVKLYSKDGQGTGGTGLYFLNTLGTNDELISKTKALLYSLIL